MKKVLTLLFVFATIISHSQYNNQVSATLSRGDGYTFPALVHDVSNKSIKHPVFIFVPGKGHNSTDLTTILTAGPAKYLQSGWNGTALNPVTSVTEEYLILNTLPGDYKLDDQYWDKFLTWLYYSSPYKDYIDTNRVIGNGFSAGGRGFAWYSMHKDLTPSHKLNWNMSFSPEMNCCDAMNALVTDSTRFIGAGVIIPPNDDSHADQVFNEVKLANQVKSNYAVFLSNPTNPCPESAGHCNLAWNYWYDPTTDTTYKDNNYNFDVGHQINIYQMGLLYSQAQKVISNNTIVLNITLFSYCVTAVSGTLISITGTSSNTTGSNTYILQLSSSSGSFQSPTNIGNQTVSGSSIGFSGTIPALTSGGTRSIRIINTTTGAISNTRSITITLASNSVAPSASQNISVGSNGNTLTVTNSSTPNSIQWYDGVNIIAGATGNTYIPNLPLGSHSITAHSVFTSCEVTAISNAVIINVASNVSPSKHYLTKGADNGVFLNACTGYQYNHGDTFVLRSSLNPYSYVTFWCFDSITVINEGGQVILTNFGSGISGGFEFKDCNHVLLTGTGSADKYGFNVKSDAGYRGVGVNVYGRSSYFESDHMNLHDKNAGFRIKMEQIDDMCDTNYAFPRWYLNHISLHDNYIHANAAESVYGLSTDPNGGRISSTHICNGVTDTLLAMRGYAFHIFNNYIDSNGRALQLAAADYDTSEIDHNTILHTGWDSDSLQGNGISLGTYCRAYVHDNYIDYSKKDGIQAFGAVNWIQNNVIHNSGNDGFGHHTVSSNIYVSSRSAQFPSVKNGTYDSTNFVIRNNDLDSNSSGWNIFVETGTGIFKKTGNIICGNTHQTDFVRPQISYTQSCDSSLSYTLVLDSVKVVQIVPKTKTFFRDSLIFTHFDSAKFVTILYAGGKPIQRYATGWSYLGLEDTTSVPVPYDSIIYKKKLVDSFFYDTLWNTRRILYGFNENNFPDYQLVDFDNAIRDLGVYVMRVPGGSVSDSSDWRDNNKRALPNIAKMRNIVGCDILFVLNMNTSSLPEQIAMLDSAHSLGIPIKYWEYGNEVSNTTSPLRAKFHNNGAEYGDTCAVWDAAIKAKYPTGKGGAWGENKSDSPTWHSDLLSVFTPDALISHLYPNEEQIIDSSTGIIDTALFAHILNNAFINAGIDSSIPVWITEYNLSPYHLDELAAGQHISGLVFMTQELQKRPEIKMLLMHSVEGDPNGAFDVDGSNNVLLMDTGKAYKQVIKL